MALGGFLNGYDTGSIGAIVAMKQFKDTVGPLSPTLLGFTVSLIMLTGGIPSVFAGHLADKFGRLRVIMAGTIFFIIGAILQGSAVSLVPFLIGRAVGGLGEGVYLSNIAVYICEIAPVKYRGMLAGCPQFMATAGVCAGYFTCYGTVGIASSVAWRFSYIIQALIGILVAVRCAFLPESPRWLMLQGRRTDALQSLQRLDFSMAEAEKDILRPQEQGLSLSGWQGFLLLFRRGYRSRTILALFVLGMVQLSGIDGVLYYAPTLFAQAGLPGKTAAFLASGLSAILMLAISIPAFLFADKWGRRTSTISGGLTLAGCMLLIGTLYAAHAVHPYGVARWVVIVLVFVFGLTYSATWGITGKIYASEIQPANTRAAATCVAQGLGFVSIAALPYQTGLTSDAYGAYFLFGGLALGTVAVLAAYMPETRGMSLESIQDAFQQPPILKILASQLRSLAPEFGRSGQTFTSNEGSELNTISEQGPSTRSKIARTDSQAEN
ncbi:hypothetical protein FKW77_000120 [Venturia effusa]|uniref:Major facilitator superfamily (MFS) profile domain-containing protein n=1 Tax=Venturia effusa TaxID=50376 RepID=A0A517LPE7_9PEZI|nr:hypothetical protein FKW77_000120 [Venturia effusa]